MPAPFQLSAKTLIPNPAIGRLLLGLGRSLAPEPAAEPACSPRYAALCRQAQWATRLFWLASAAIGAVAVAGAAHSLLAGV